MEAEETSDDGVGLLIAGGAVLVALTTPLNLVLLLFCWSLVAAIAGPSAADNSSGWLALLGGVVNVGLYLALCGVAGIVFRRSALFRQRVALAVVLALHLGLWLGLSFAFVAQMAATGVWL